MNGRNVHLPALVLCRRRGLSALYMVLIMTVLFAFASLAMDYGKVQLVKSELRTATDVACKWGVQWVNAGKAKALTHVNDAAARQQHQWLGSHLHGGRDGSGLLERLDARLHAQR
jgi:Flp pilus assembly protein TadG